MAATEIGALQLPAESWCFYQCRQSLLNGYQPSWPLARHDSSLTDSRARVRHLVRCGRPVGPLTDR